MACVMVDGSLDDRRPYVHTVIQNTPVWSSSAKQTATSFFTSVTT
jgi:hypothetical protein